MEKKDFQFVPIALDGSKLPLFQANRIYLDFSSYPDGPNGGELLRGPEEAEIRALAVRPEARGRGVGRALVDAVIGRAASLGVRHLLLLTQQEMTTAHRIYEEAGFARLPARDRSPQPGVDLLAYGLDLDVR